MEQTAQIKECAHTVAGIVAHVDAGKTTLAESMLYLTGGTRKLGRVDHKDAFLDTYELEKNRGITIFSKQAELNLKNRKLTLLDTPGHVDFSAEMERTLQVLDYAILVISVADGVSGHVQTLWRLLKQYNVPVFLFINKMDQPGADKEETLLQLQKRLDGRCVDFSDLENFDERLAETDEELLEQFFETGKIRLEHIKKQIKDRKLFPCYFGSALKMQGITEFLEGFEMYTTVPVYGDLFGARVFKIARDAQGKRLTYLKVTGGVLKAKQVIGEEKIDQIRVYSGASFTSVSEAQPGMVCAVTGLNDTVTGQGLGCEIQAQTPILEPVLTYCVSFSPEIDIHEMYRKLSVLEEEAQKEDEYAQGKISVDEYMKYRDEYHMMNDKNEAIDMVYEKYETARKNGSWMIFDGYYDQLFRMDRTQWGLMLSVFLVIVLLVCCEPKELLATISVTREGRRGLWGAKLRTILMATLIFVILFAVEELMVIRQFSPLSYLDAPIQSISCLAGKHITISIAHWYLLTLLLRVVNTMIFAVVTYSILYFIQNKKVGVLILAVLIFGPVLAAAFMQYDTWNILAKWIMVYPVIS